MPYQDFNPRSHKGSDGIITVIQIGRVISIHAPTRGATCFPLISLSSLSISIHAPTRGATTAALFGFPQSRHFNPRSHKGSDRCLDPGRFVEYISIHAPTRGATFTRKSFSACFLFQSTLPQGERLPGSVFIFSIRRFQSTLPQGERHEERAQRMNTKKFQSTLPQGERHFMLFFNHLKFDFNPRSHKGSDASTSVSKSALRYFNPRSHKGSDDENIDYDGIKNNISIHAPTRGATTSDVCKRFIQLISIHAPTRGATANNDVNEIAAWDFNPRSHKGSDPNAGVSSMMLC